jgi:L-ascorbate metabolism protein UlaG (beta-lactamase superfamily)
LGGGVWTMDVDDALEAVKLISPKMVIPCHYSVPLFFYREFAPADDQRFKMEVEKMGIECRIMKYGDAIEIDKGQI